MARKKKSEAASTSRARVDLRLEREVYERIKEMAEQPEISINQLLQGIVTWASGCGNPGERVILEENQPPREEKRAGCIWFGCQGYVVKGKDGSEQPVMGDLHFQLDYTDRGAVRDLPDGWERIL